MTLRDLMNRSLAGLFVVLLIAGLITPAAAQPTPLTRVDFSITGLDYDVVYLADFLEITSGKLKEFIPSFSAEMRPMPPGSSGQIRLHMQTIMMLQGEPRPFPLSEGVTMPFTLSAQRNLFSRDLARGGSSDIRMAWTTQWSSSDGRKKLEDHLKKFPSAPVGTYRFVIEALPAAGTTVLGRIVKDLVVRNASPEEVIVTLLDPQPGEIVHTTTPVFSWRCDREASVFVYERLPMQRSLQDAVSGVPHAVIKAGTAQTASYGAAGRRLEYGKTYIWFVRTTVKTNRGDVDRDSELRSFRVLPAGKTLAALRDALGLDNEALAGTLETLEGIGWSPNGDITLDGRTLSIDELKVLLRQLSSKGTKITVRVE